MSDADLEAIRREHRQRLFDRYEKEAAAFSRLFTALLVFSALFLAFALVPYTLLQNDRQLIARNIEDAKRTLAQRTHEVEARAAELAGLQATAREQEALLKDLGPRVRSLEARTRDAETTIARNQAETTNNAEVQKQTTEALRALADAQAVIGATRTDPEATVREIQADLRQLFQDERSPRPDGACAEGDSAQRIGCRLRLRMSVRINERLEPLEKKVVPAIAADDQAGAAALQARLNVARDRLGRLLVDRPDFWRTLNEKEGFSGELEQNFRLVLKDLQQVADRSVEGLRKRGEELKKTLEGLQADNVRLQNDVAKARAQQEQVAGERAQLQGKIALATEAQAKARADQARLEAEVATLGQDKAGLEEAQALSKDKRDEIAKRLSSIQSPFGALPIGLREGILSFPLVVALAYLIGAGSLAEAIRLRGTCHRLYRQWDQQGQVVTDSQLALFAPLWLDPTLGARAQPVAIALLLLPVPIFLGAVGLVAYLSSIADAPPLRGTAGWALYGLASLAALGAILVALARLRKAWLAYPQIASAEAPSA